MALLFEKLVAAANQNVIIPQTGVTQCVSCCRPTSSGLLPLCERYASGIALSFVLAVFCHATSPTPNHVQLQTQHGYSPVLSLIPPTYTSPISYPCSRNLWAHCSLPLHYDAGVSIRPGYLTRGLVCYIYAIVDQALTPPLSWSLFLHCFSPKSIASLISPAQTINHAWGHR